MDEIRPAELERAPERGGRRAALEQRDGHDEPGECQPADRTEGEPRQQKRRGQEDGSAEQERSGPAARLRASPRCDGARDGIRGREERRQRGEHNDPARERSLDRELVRDGDGQPEGQADPEPAPVEPDRLGDELADGSRLGRKRGRKLGHASDRSGPVRPRHLAGQRSWREDPLVNATPEAALEREDVTAILTALFDIRSELVRIRRAVEDGNGEEEETEADA